MKIDDIGKIKEGLVDEVSDNCIRIYDEKQYPIIELFGRLDECGNYIDSPDDLQKLARDLVDVWNETIAKRFLEKDI